MIKSDAAPLAVQASPVLARPLGGTCCTDVRRDTSLPPQEETCTVRTLENIPTCLASLSDALPVQGSHHHPLLGAAAHPGGSANAANRLSTLRETLKTSKLARSSETKTARLPHRQQKQQIRSPTTGKERSHFASACGGGLAACCLLLRSSHGLLKS